MDKKLACPVCASHAYARIGKSLDRHGDHIDLLCCEMCSTFFPDFRAGDEASEVARQVTFHENWWDGETPESMLSLRDSAASMVDFYRGDLGVPDEEGKLIVEIGAGRGNLTAALVAAGYTVMSCEPSLALSQRAREVYDLDHSQLASATASQLISEINENKNPAHAVFLWHVLEHVTEPLKLLQDINSILVEGGFLFLQVPLPCDDYIYPEHLFFGSPASLRKMAAKTGYRVSFLTHIPEVGFLSATFVKDSSVTEPAFDSALIPAISEMANLLGRTTIPSSLQIEQEWLIAIRAFAKQNSVQPVDRSVFFSARSHGRYWWYWLKQNRYVPPVIRSLSNDEWNIINEWFYDTEAKFESPWELSISAVSIVYGLIGGNGISRVVQCGHHIGFSSLILGFLMRNMAKRRSVFSIDDNIAVNDYAAGWLDRADLRDYVKLAARGRFDPQNGGEAVQWLGGRPQVILIDGSHEYGRTLQELDFWYDQLCEGGFILVHDTSIFAQQFDVTGEGGALKAVSEWSEQRNVWPLLLNDSFHGRGKHSDLVYSDGCGLAIIQK